MSGYLANPFVWLGRLGLSGLLLLAFVGTAARAEEPTSADSPGYDRHLRRVLPVLIHKGAALYNDGDPEACCRLFESTLVVVRPTLVDRPQLLLVIDRGLADARKITDIRDRAFALRAVLDAIRSAVGAGQSQTNPSRAGSAPAEPRPPTPGFTLSRDEQAVLDLTNAERKKAGVAPLRANEKLCESARAHSANMAGQNQLAHVLDGEGPGERLRKVGYRALTWGENCAAGQRTADEAVSGWMQSEGHRRNLLNPQYTEIGIGVATSTSGIRYWTQVFGTPVGQ